MHAILPTTHAVSRPPSPRQCSFGDFRKLARSADRTETRFGEPSRSIRSRTSAPALPDDQTRRHNPPRSGISSSFTVRILSPARTPACSAGPLSARPPTTSVSSDSVAYIPSHGRAGRFTRP